ncbi:hypothetical protein [Scytonema sp. NUACC26]
MRVCAVLLFTITFRSRSKRTDPTDGNVPASPIWFLMYSRERESISPAI